MNGERLFEFETNLTFSLAFQPERAIFSLHIGLRSRLRLRGTTSQLDGNGRTAMALAAARVERTRPARDVDDLGLVLRARAGDKHALDQMIRRYAGFVRLKASSYFIAGGDSGDLRQEALRG